MKIVNIKTGNKLNRIPRRLQVPGHGLVMDPSEEQAALAGYYPVAEWSGEVPEGERIASYSYEIDEDGVAQESVTFESIPPPEPLTDDLKADLSLLRELLENVFGRGAHVDRKMTPDALEDFVIGQRRGMTVNDFRDALAAERVFGRISAQRSETVWELMEMLEAEEV